MNQNRDLFVTFLYCAVLAWGFAFFSGCSNASDEVTVPSFSQDDKSTKSNEAKITNVVAAMQSVHNDTSLQLVSSKVTSVDWPRFRGADGLGVAAAATLPTKWSENENLVWKTELPGAGASSPIIIGDRIFLTCYHGFGIPDLSGGNTEDVPSSDIENLRLELVSLNRDTGEILWTKTVTPSLPEQATIREQHGYSSSTPVADSERIYVFFGKSGVFAFDYDGNRLWHADVGSTLHGWGTAASPVLFEDMVIVNASIESESLVALDKSTGAERWRAAGIREAWNTPLLMAVDGGATELIVPIFGEVLGVDPHTGKRLWSCNTGIKWYMVPSVIARDGIIYCIGGRSSDSLAILAGGRGDVTETHLLWSCNRGANVPSPILYQGHLYWIHDNLGIAYCVEAATGEIVYEERLLNAGRFYASPVLADGKLYYVNRSGRAFVIAAKPEFELLATNELEQQSRFDASPAVADGRLFLRSNRFLYCIGNESLKSK